MKNKIIDWLIVPMPFHMLISSSFAPNLQVKVVDGRMFVKHLNGNISEIHFKPYSPGSGAHIKGIEKPLRFDT